MVKMKDSGIEWIGEIPETWKVVRGKNILKLLSRKVEPDYEIITAFRDGQVTLRKNRRTEGFTISTKEIGYQGVKANDLVVHAMDGFAGAIGISDADGKASPVLNILDSNQNKRYVMYYLRVCALLGVFQALAKGIRIRTADTRWDTLKNLNYLLPPKSEQQQIADYLDHKTVEIDGLIDKINTEIDTLKQYQSSVITRAVTKGLDPNVPMKDSGIEWIGEIPEKWKVAPLYKYFSERKNKNRAGNEKNLLSLSYGRIVRKNIEAKGGLLPESFTTYNIIEPGDIIIRPTDLQNDKRSLRTGLSGEHGIITSAYIDLAPDGGTNSKYHYYLLHSYDIQKVFYNMGNGVRQGLNYNEFSKLKVLVPERLEQQQIVDYLDNKVSQIQNIIKSKQQQIDQLTGYKNSLIFEYVTGKKQVKEAN